MMKVQSGTANWFSEEGARLDATFHLSEGRGAKMKILKSPFPITTMDAVTNRIFYGGRSKRIYVEPQYGIPFIGSSDMLQSEFFGSKNISKKKTPDLPSYYVEKGWTLVSRSGTIGNTIYANDDFIGKAFSEHIIRVVPTLNSIKSGYLYAFLASRYGYALLTQGTFGAVIQHIEPHHIAGMPVPLLPETEQQRIHDLVEDAARLRVEANKLLGEARWHLLKEAGLPHLTTAEYEYFGHHVVGRPVSVFSTQIQSSVSLAAFNHSQKINKIVQRIKTSCKTKPLYKLLDGRGIFSTGSFKRLEHNSPNSIELINQSDIFNVRIEGKKLAALFVKGQELVEYGEVLIAGVGTLGENETFCRALFAGEELAGKLISGEFIRMKTSSEIPAGYLYCWLSCEYGFRLLRATHTGTKLCRPILTLLKDIPVPILASDRIHEIDEMVKKAHSKRWKALQLENLALGSIESAISSW